MSQPQVDTPALEAAGLSKRYLRGALALDDVSVSVRAGSLTALVGPNAAGKSTLIKTWVAFERPTRGSVRVAGLDPWDDRVAALSRLGYVPQQPALYRGLTVAEHLAWAGHVRSGFDRESAVQHLESLDVPLGARPTALSGGQQAQVMLAIALGTRAEILLLDEPLASLDPLARSELLGIVHAAVRERGATVLLSSHIVTDIEQVCDRLIVLGVGHVLLDSSIADAMATHRIVPGIQAPAGLTAIGVLPDEAGGPRILARMPDGHVSSADAALVPATLDEVVKGYLVAGRQQQSQRAA